MTAARALFPPELPEGFLYHENFLSETEETELVRAFQGESFAAFDFHGYMAKRRVVRYGVDYEYGTRHVNPIDPIPDFLLSIRDRAGAFAGVAPEELIQGMILEYPPGAPIGWHRDAPQFGIVIGISLLSSARMRLKPYTVGTSKEQNAPAKRQPTVSIELAPRSIYVLSGTARSAWQHSIPAVENLRYSITFRTVREGRLRKSD
jgi:alkylated DNA repair dioxygenase AlkB